MMWMTMWFVGQQQQHKEEKENTSFFSSDPTTNIGRTSSQNSEAEITQSNQN